jgi:hypothetical protein
MAEDLFLHINEKHFPAASPVIADKNSGAGHSHVLNNFGTPAVCKLCKADYMKILSIPSKNQEHIYA